jgi:Concanavalin A-like lectin/glucanases superfamily
MRRVTKMFSLLVVLSGLGLPPFLRAAEPSIPTDGLVAHFPFSGNALDAGPLQNNGTLHGASLSSDRFGRTNSSLHLNGTGDFFETRSSLPESESITVSLWLSLESWVQLNNWVAPQVIFFEGDDGGGRDVGCYVMGGFHFVVKSNDSLSYPNWLPSLGSWIHLVCVADSVGNKMAIWIDGRKVKEGEFSGGANVGFHSRFNLGRRPGVYNDWFLAGSLDEVRVYNRALSDEEIGILHALEGGRVGSVGIAVERVRLTLNVVPGVAYLLQSSPDLLTWSNIGTRFVASASVQQVTVDAMENERFWRLVQVP